MLEHQRALECRAASSSIPRPSASVMQQQRSAVFYYQTPKINNNVSSTVGYNNRDLQNVQVQVGTLSPPSTPGWNPRLSMAYDSAKGLLNPVGENNCFLNSAIQVLWNLDAFRRNFRMLHGHACMGSSCIFCALKALFNQYQFSNCPALPANQLRDALAQTFADQHRYQLGVMDDAAECFENILMRIHVHLAHGKSEDTCQEPHCIPHQKFSMTVLEQAVCECEATCEPFSYSQIVHYVSTTTVINYSRSASRGRRPKVTFGNLLSYAASELEARTCPKKCGGLVSMRRTLANRPDVISIGFVWDSDQPSSKHISHLVNSIGTVLHPAEMFQCVVDAEWAVSTKFHLVGVVCYYGKHYSTFFFHSKMRIWILFDDSKVKKLGTDWKCVVDRCCRGKYQPLLLLYANPETQPIDVSSSPTTVMQIHDQRYSERTRDVTRRSLLPQRDFDSNVADQVRTSAVNFDTRPRVHRYERNSVHEDREIELQRNNSHPHGYFNAVDETFDSDHETEADGTSHNDTMSSIASHGSNLSAAYRPNASNVRRQFVTSTASNVSAIYPAGRAPAAAEVKIVKQNGRSTSDEYDATSYITAEKVHKVLASQRQQAASGAKRCHGDGQKSKIANETYSVRRGDLIDEASETSHKDSGYRSNEDRLSSASPSSSPTLSASTSTFSMDGIPANYNLSCPGNGNSMAIQNRGIYDSKSLCSSLESLLSNHTSASLPVANKQQLRFVPVPANTNRSNGQHPVGPPIKQSSGNPTFAGQRLITQPSAHHLTNNESSTKQSTDVRSPRLMKSSYSDQQFCYGKEEHFSNGLERPVTSAASARRVNEYQVDATREPYCRPSSRDDRVVIHRKVEQPQDPVLRCDRAEIQVIREPVVDHQAMAINILSRTQQSDTMIMSKEEQVPMYPYRGHPGDTEKAAVKVESQPDQNQPVYVKGRKNTPASTAVNPTPLYFEPVKKPHAPPTQLRNAPRMRDNNISATRNKPGEATGRGVPSVLTDRSGSMGVKSKSAMNLSQKSTKL